jgi:hypothetical protein
MASENDPNGIVLFLGAGASSWAGYRTFLNFPAMFWPSGDEPSKLEVTDKERTLLKEIKSHLAKRRLAPTLDSYLAAIYDFQLFTSNSVSHTVLRERVLTSSVQWAGVQELRSLLMTIRDRICRLTAKHYREPLRKGPLDQIPRVYDFYQRLWDLAHGRLSVFTTNYDILPEYLFSNNPYFKSRRRGMDSGFSFDNGFPRFAESQLDGESDWPTFSAEEGQDGYSSGRVLKWHRLHGCVAWRHGGLGEREIYFDLRPTQSIPNFSERLCVSYRGHEEAYGRVPHSPAFRKLSEAVNQASMLVFIGFAFRDVDVMAVIGHSLDDVSRCGGKVPRVLVIDPQLTHSEALARVQRSMEAVAAPCIDWDENMFEIIPAMFPSETALNRIQQMNA